MANSPEVKQFIRENKDLFWYIKESEKENISHEVLVEFILNYGNEKQVKKLFDLLGLDHVAEIFYRQTHKEDPIVAKRINYLPLVLNYFDLYFTKHVASAYTKR
ncbi:MAG: hypothetical protein HYY40_03060 [Bacteroidetes bacterium]|nr:hypothetical protein [Bacteroidota bacterium]